MLYQVVQPFFYEISADSVNNAIKNFVKIHHDLNVAKIIITDQTNHYSANMKYFIEDGRNRVGINVFPYSGPIVMGPAYTTYIETLPGATGTPITPILPATVPATIWDSSYPLSPYSSPVFVPTIIDLNLR